MLRQSRWKWIWQEVQRFTLLIVGTLVAALAFSVFQAPYHLIDLCV